MKKKIGLFLFCFMLIQLCILSNTVKADSGPKPSVNITFRNMGDELCYGTLLSKVESTGPAYVWDGSKENCQYSGLDHDTWEAFVNYKDSDGYYFLQRGWRLNETKLLDWTYYPPDTFKILLYYPKTKTFVVSGIYEKYAFDSNFTVDMAGIEIKSVEAQKPVLVAEKDYDYMKVLSSLFGRIMLTLLIEIGIAFLFGFGHKKYLVWITAANIVTQIFLNVTLNIINYRQDHGTYVLLYILLEFIVFLIEAIFYNFIFNRKRKEYVSVEKCVKYSLAANAASFLIGAILLSTWFQGLLETYL